MLGVLAHNYNHKNDHASLYEVGTVYQPTEKGKLPIESQKAAIGIYGNGADFYSLKGIVEKLLDRLNIAEYDIEAVTDNPTFHPGRSAKLTIDGKLLATIGEIHPKVAEAYGIGVKVYVAEVDVNTAYDNRLGTRTPQAAAEVPRNYERPCIRLR
jgi:phenylalanyl-tRNA synthetase beta chain